MRNRSEILDPKPKIVVAGAGPAGTSLAIRLAQRDFDVTLIERETFPRHKLCGEFISPECLAHFDDIGVLESMLSGGGEHITETHFYEPGGKAFSVSSESFNGQGFALSLSRAEMDMRLLDRAKSIGVTVFEDSSVNAVAQFNGRITHLTVRRGSGEKIEVTADLFIDATGRARVLSKLTAKQERSLQTAALHKKSLFVGFKSHLQDARVDKGVCEIYLFPGGYSGLSRVEVGMTNHCFLVESSVAREFGGDPDKIVENVVFRNKRAAKTLADATPVQEWLAVSIESFGMSKPGNATNLLCIGDSAAFIDPFTGSGMLLAFESSRLLAEVILQNQCSPDTIADIYRARYERQFARRLRVCSVLRRAAFVPH
ncbi:MAG: NAD(P)/FAD-dependent oxidoreductase, partial [Pyrinomonadaceae bacterium]